VSWQLINPLDRSSIDWWIGYIKRIRVATDLFVRLMAGTSFWEKSTTDWFVLREKYCYGGR
jgi:hypothetical protein